jgi:hypothetical protein
VKLKKSSSWWWLCVFGIRLDILGYIVDHSVISLSMDTYLDSYIYGSCGRGRAQDVFSAALAEFHWATVLQQYHENDVPVSRNVTSQKH